MGIICFFGFSQKSIEDINDNYNYFSYEGDDALWFSSGQAWHRYDGKKVKTFAVSDESSGLKGTFVQSSLFPDKQGKLWTTTHEYLCYFDAEDERFNCMQPVFEGDTLRSFKGLEFFEEENAFLFAHNQLLLLFNTHDFSAEYFTRKLTNNVFVSAFDEKEGELFTSPWVSKPLFERWKKNGKEVEYELIDFTDCSSKLENITVSDFAMSNDHYWLATSKGLVKWKEGQSCKSRLFLYKNQVQTIINIYEYMDHFLVTTDKNGILIFNINEEKYLRKLHSTHPTIPLNSNFVLDVFEKGSSLIISYHDASLQEIDKALVNKEILLGESPQTNGNFLMIESNAGYLAISDRNSYIHIFDKSLTKIHEVDLSSLKMLTDMCFVDSQLFFSTVDQLQVVDVLTSAKLYSLRNERNINSLFIDRNSLYLIGADYVQKIKEFSIDGQEESRIPSLIFFLKQAGYTISTSTTVLRIEKGDYVQDYNFSAFIEEIKNGRNDNEIVIRSAGKLFLLDIKREKLTPLLFENLKISGTMVKDSNEIIVWDENGIYCVDSENSIRKIIHAENPFQVQYFWGRYMYTSGIKMYVLGEDQLIQKQNEFISINSSTYPYEPTNGTYNITYKYFQEPLTLDFTASSVIGNENNFFSITYEDKNLEKEFHSYQDAITFNRFSQGKHKFEVQGYNQDGTKANKLSFVVRIKGPFYQQWWFYTILGTILIGGTIVYFRNREKRLKDKYVLEQEINNLQKAALQAQMNPHFIFNCLNSIQSFIMKNDKENAMDYLGQFARLIRANLNASLTDKISLEEEVRILENYLSLEKLRMNDVFQYDINISQDLKSIDIFFPPMLVQPFVENAVIHGMYGKTAGGLIVVEFQKEGETLLVNVIDNGGTRAEKKETEHKSVGVEITQKRLAHINKSASDQFNVHMEQTENTTTVQLKVRYTREAEE